MVIQNGLTHAVVSWEPVEQPVTGYMVYYTTEGQSESLTVKANETEAIVADLIPGATYSIEILALSSTLPSNLTATEFITIGEFLKVKLSQVSSLCFFTEAANISLTSFPSYSPIMVGSAVNLTCSISLPSQVVGAPYFRWVGSGASPSTIYSQGELSSILTLSEIQPSQAGSYNCTVTIGGSIFISTDIIVSGKCKIDM